MMGLLVPGGSLFRAGGPRSLQREHQDGNHDEERRSNDTKADGDAACHGKTSTRRILAQHPARAP
jgi:hypothetical protein